MGRGGGGGGAFKKNKTLHSHNLVLSDRFLRIRGCPDSLPSSGQSAAAPVRPARLPLPRTAAEARWALLFHSEWRRKRCLHVVWGRSHFRFQRGKRVIRSEVEVCQHAEARQLMCPVRELGQAIVFRVLRFFLFFLSSPPPPTFWVNDEWTEATCLHQQLTMLSRRGCWAPSCGLEMGYISPLVWIELTTVPHDTAEQF